ncbi:MAG: hypothetical protein ACK56I_24890, partial [bacterium]
VIAKEMHPRFGEGPKNLTPSIQYLIVELHQAVQGTEGHVAALPGWQGADRRCFAVGMETTETGVQPRASRGGRRGTRRVEHHIGQAAVDFR